MNSAIEELMGYICDDLCVHAAEDSDYLTERCKECKLEEYCKKIQSRIGTNYQPGYSKEENDKNDI